MKKFLLTLTAIGLYTAIFTCCVNAEENIKLITNGSECNYEVKWNNEHNRLLVSSDFVKEYFDASIEFDSNTINISKNQNTLQLKTDDEFYIMNGLGGRKIGYLTEIVNNKAYLPLRYICEAFGANVSYNTDNKTTYVTTNSIVVNEEIKKYFENVQVFDQSTIRITGEKTIYVDPRRILGEPKDADIIFITHTHNDHYEIDSIKRVMNENTQIFITNDGIEQARLDGLTNVTGVEPGKSYIADGISFSTVKAYNTAEQRQNHKAEFNWVGYIFTVNGYTYYSAGDSDLTPEMQAIDKEIDVAFLPIDGKYNMDYKEAAQAANTISPKVAVPYHYNNFVPEENAEEFVKLLDEKIMGAIVAFKM